MNIAPARMSHGFERRRTGRFGSALVSAALVAAFLVIATPGAGAETLATNGLKRVSVTSYQALPPPYKPGHAVLKSAAALRGFEDALRADHIGVTSHPTTAEGCAGGIQYTVNIVYSTGRHTVLDAYYCGGSLTGNMTGHVKKFIGYLSVLRG